MDERLFCSDLHLSPERPETMALFRHFLATRAKRASQLYILGDLFDAWIGDDDDLPPYQRIRQALRALTRGGTGCTLLPGNRDFLLGKAFCRATGCRLLPDPSLLIDHGQRILLMHGDLLCTDDLAYQRFRRRVRNPLLKRLFLWKSLEKRRAIARDYRRKSAQATAQKRPQVMDVNQTAVQAYLARFQATHLIHGHIHRPSTQIHEEQGVQIVRHVLAEWWEDRGEILSLSERGWHREAVQFD